MAKQKKSKDESVIAQCCKLREKITNSAILVHPEKRRVSTKSLVETFVDKPCYHGQFSGDAYIRNGKVSPISQVCGNYMEKSSDMLTHAMEHLESEKGKPRKIPVYTGRVSSYMRPEKITTYSRKSKESKLAEKSENPFVKLKNVERILNYHSRFSLVFPLLEGSAEGYTKAKTANERFCYSEAAKPIYRSLIKSLVDCPNDPLIEEAFSALRAAYPTFILEMEKSRGNKK